MEEKLNEKVEEFSLERLKRAAEELNKIGVNPVRGQRGALEAQTPLEVKGLEKEYKDNKPLTGQREQISNGVKIAGTALPDLIQERMKLEKILQEMNNLKSKICQRIELIKTIERREKELNQQLASARKENDFPDQVRERFENLKENIK